MQRQLACALGALLIITTQMPAQAIAGSSCGGSSGGGGGSSSSGGGGGGGSSSSSSSSTPSCVQTTKTVGRAECRSFGDGWDRSNQPRIRLSMGLVHQSLSLAGKTWEGESTHDENTHAYHYDPSLTSTPSQAELFGGAFGIHFLIRNAHLGMATSITGGDTDGATQISNAGLHMRSTFALQVESTAVAGYATRMGKWGLLGELQAGMRITSVQVETRLADCIATAMTSDFSAIVRPQFTVQRWLSPWLTTDLSVGSDLMQDRDLNMVLSLTAHSRSYDGMY